jgi:hypothetical protein
MLCFLSDIFVYVAFLYTVFLYPIYLCMLRFYIRYICTEFEVETLSTHMYTHSSLTKYHWSMYFRTTLPISCFKANYFFLLVGPLAP